jgi:tRNA-dependent cyclodipeptide synthase
MRSDSAFEKLNLPAVSIVKTTPNVTQAKLFSYKRCYIGISLDNPALYGKSLQALLLWGLGNFDQVLVVIGDCLRRYNEQIFNGLSPKEAQTAARSLGDTFLEKTAKFFNQIPTDRLSLIRWQDCLESAEYKKAKQILDDLFARETAFRASVQRDAWSYIKRQKKTDHALAVSEEIAIELSCSYLLEEIAVFSSLSEQGWKVELYPGPELKVLEEIAKGIYQGIPEGLKDRINVELKNSKRS